MDPIERILIEVNQDIDYWERVMGQIFFDLGQKITEAQRLFLESELKMSRKALRRNIEIRDKYQNKEGKHVS